MSFSFSPQDLCSSVGLFETRLSMKFSATLLSCCLQPRPYGSSVVGAWPAHANVLFLCVLHVWVTSFYYWSWPVVEMVSSGRLSLGWFCVQPILFTCRHQRWFLDDSLFNVSIMYLFIVMLLLVLFLSSLSLPMSFRYYWFALGLVLPGSVFSSLEIVF